MVMLKRTSLMVAGLAMLFMTVGTRADERDKMTILTFNQSVAVPGTVLPAGTYVFKLVDPRSLSVVQVSSAKENKVLTTFNAIPIEGKAHERTFINFEERPVGVPEPIHQWWYPGDPTGLEFQYR
jgi:hypothetical protein